MKRNKSISLTLALAFLIASFTAFGQPMIAFAADLITSLYFEIDHTPGEYLNLEHVTITDERYELSSTNYGDVDQIPDEYKENFPQYDFLEGHYAGFIVLAVEDNEFSPGLSEEDVSLSCGVVLKVEWDSPGQVFVHIYFPPEGEVPAPTVSVSPPVWTGTVGQTALFTATASSNADAGPGTFSYQWYKDGVPLAGKTSYQLSISPVASSDAGMYTCRVREDVGGDLSPEGISNAAQLVVSVPIIDITAAGVTGLVAPAPGSAPSGAASPAHTTYTVTSVTWSPNPVRFGYDEAYAATVVLTANAGHRFAGTIAPTANAGAAGAGTITGGAAQNTLTFTVTFAATGP
ncbi:MAG: immunoglobulin domain-containing protein, partial [Oscillospiraceae bacterium]|nr:immunoglobulin domain-containing protein [Oscillospiraceae bacterium]